VLEILGRLVHIYLHTLPGADVSWESWQLVSAIHDEADGLTLVSDSHKVMVALIVVSSSKGCCGVLSAIS
jgi:hypothetical protein